MSILTFLIEYKWTILFYLVIILLVYINKRKFDIEGKIVALYRTKVGLRFIDRFVKGKEELIKILGLCGIGIGYIGMLAVFYLMFRLLLEALKQPAVFTVSPVLPGVPIAGIGIKFPLVIGWISLLVIIVIHEFSHGIVAKAFKQKIKSSGVAFIGPILGAFVEIDEKKLQKQPDHVQYSVFAAGPNSNIITSLIFMLLLGLLVAPAITAMEVNAGVKIDVHDTLPADLSGLKSDDVIVKINNQSTQSVEDFLALGNTVPDETYIFHTKDGRAVEVVSRPHPENASLGQFGIDLYQETALKNPSGINTAWHAVLLWIRELLFWLFLIGLNIGLINFLPIFITDGARMLQISLNRMIKDQEKAKKTWLFINRLGLLIIILLFLIPIIMRIFEGLSSLA